MLYVDLHLVIIYPENWHYATFIVFVFNDTIIIIIFY